MSGEQNSPSSLGVKTPTIPDLKLIAPGLTTLGVPIYRVPRYLVPARGVASYHRMLDNTAPGEQRVIGDTLVSRWADELDEIGSLSSLEHFHQIVPYSSWHDGVLHSSWDVLDVGKCRCGTKKEDVKGNERLRCPCPLLRLDSVPGPWADRRYSAEAGSISPAEES